MISRQAGGLAVAIAAVIQPSLAAAASLTPAAAAHSANIFSACIGARARSEETTAACLTQANLRAHGSEAIIGLSKCVTTNVPSRCLQQFVTGWPLSQTGTPDPPAPSHAPSSKPVPSATTSLPKPVPPSTTPSPKPVPSTTTPSPKPAPPSTTPSPKPVPSAMTTPSQRPSHPPTPIPPHGVSGGGSNDVVVAIGVAVYGILLGIASLARWNVQKRRPRRKGKRSAIVDLKGHRIDPPNLSS